MERRSIDVVTVRNDEIMSLDVLRCFFTMIFFSISMGADCEARLRRSPLRTAGNNTKKTAAGKEQKVRKTEGEEKNRRLVSVVP